MVNEIIQLYNGKCFIVKSRIFKQYTKSVHLFQSDIRKELIKK